MSNLFSAGIFPSPLRDYLNTIDKDLLGQTIKQNGGMEVFFEEILEVTKQVCPDDGDYAQYLVEVVLQTAGYGMDEWSNWLNNR